MLQLKIREVAMFEERAGMSFARAMGTFRNSMCVQHRHVVRACGSCTTGQLCGEHQEAFSECERCTGADIPVNVAAALVFVLRRRAEPELAWEAIEEMEYVEMVTALGNAMGSQDGVSNT